MPTEHPLEVLAAAITAAVETALDAQTEEWLKAILDHDVNHREDWVSQKLSDPRFARGFLREQKREAVAAAIDARERELVPEVCPYWCGQGYMPHRIDWRNEDSYWEHQNRCPASPLHEAIYQRERAGDERRDG